MQASKNTLFALCVARQKDFHFQGDLSSRYWQIVLAHSWFYQGLECDMMVTSIASLPNTTTRVLAKQLSTTSSLSYTFYTAVPAGTISLRLHIPNGSALLYKWVQLLITTPSRSTGTIQSSLR
jgi:hypothetical protein